MAKKKELKGLLYGDHVEVKETGQRGIVRGEYYTGGNIKDPVYSVEFNNGETRHYTLEQLSKLDKETEDEI